MKLRKPEIVLICVTLALILLAAGYFAGRAALRSGAEPVLAVTSDERPGEEGAAAAPQREPPGEAAAPAGPEKTPEKPEGPLNLNTADETALCALPGIGPELASRIVAYRSDFGPFTSEEELLEVRGIGEKKLKALEGLITVGE